MCGDGRGRGSTLSPLYNRQTGTVAHPRAGGSRGLAAGRRACARLGDTLRSATGDGCPSPEQLEEEERDNAYDKAVGSSRSWSTAASISGRLGIEWRLRPLRTRIALEARACRLVHVWLARACVADMPVYLGALLWLVVFVVCCLEANGP